jgi:ribosomal protein S18 acetylase RimI-like enzyme
MVLVRDMQAADLGAVGTLAEALVRLHHQWDTTRFFTTPDVAEGYRRFFRGQLGDERTLLLSAELDGRVVGYLYGTVEGRDWAKLLDPHGAVHDVFVDASARRHGVARALLEAARARFAARGLVRVVLYSATANEEGQALFRSLGYRPTMVELTLDLGPK